MAAGDVNIYGPYRIGDTSSIDTGLTGNVVVADTLINWTDGEYVFFLVVKAA